MRGMIEALGETFTVVIYLVVIVATVPPLIYASAVWVKWWLATLM